MRTATVRAVAISMFAAAMVSACSSDTKDERAWVRGFVSRAEDQLTSFGLQPSTSVYVGPCNHHSADVAWQGHLNPNPHAYGNLTQVRPRYELSEDVSARMLLAAQLSSDDVHIIAANRLNHVTSKARSQIIVLKPATGTRIQVIAPDPQSVVVTGYAGC